MFKIAPAPVSGVMLAVWEVAATLVLLLPSLERLYLATAAFVQRRSKLPLLAFSALLDIISDSYPYYWLKTATFR